MIKKNTIRWIIFKKNVFLQNINIQHTIMKTGKHHYRFHTSKDLEVNHLIVPFNSIYLEIALMLFIVGQLVFFFCAPLLADTLHINKNLTSITAHFFTWAGEVFLLYSLMRSMVVLRKPLRILFIATLVGLTIFHWVMILLSGFIEIEEGFNAIIYFILMIPYLILGQQINHSYYDKLSVAGTLMLLTAFVNLAFYVAQEMVGQYLIFDIIRITVAIIYIIFLRMRLVGSENVKDISRLLNNRKKAEDEGVGTGINKKEIVRNSRKDIDLNYVISPEPRMRMDIAAGAFILAQVLLFLCAPVLSSILGVHRATFIFFSHLLKGFAETYLIYCLMKGMATTKYPLQKLFLATIAVVLLFNFGVAFLAFMSYFNIHVLGEAFIPLILIRTIPYFMLGFFIYQRYYGLVSHLGMAMMLFLFGNLLIEGFLLSATTLIYDIMLFVISASYVIFLRKVLIGHDTYKEQQQ